MNTQDNFTMTASIGEGRAEAALNTLNWSNTSTSEKPFTHWDFESRTSRGNLILVECKEREKTYNTMLLEFKKASYLIRELEGNAEVKGVTYLNTIRGSSKAYIWNLTRDYLKTVVLTHKWCPSTTCGSTHKVLKDVFLLPLKDAKEINY